MGDVNEIWRLTLDPSGYEQGVARVEELDAQIAQKRGRGEDVSELEKQRVREVEALEKLKKKQKDASGSTEDLLKQKEKLGAVVRTLGGNFSGLIGDLGGVVEMMGSASTGSIAVAAGLAALAAGSAVWAKLNDGAQRYADTLDRIAEHQKQLREESQALQEQLADMLEKAGLAGKGATQAATTKAQELAGKEGVMEQVAAFGAVAAQVGGLDDAQMRAVMAGYLQSGRSASFTGDPEKDKAMLAELAGRGTDPAAQAFFAERVAATAQQVIARNVRPERRPEEIYAAEVDKAARRLGLSEADRAMLRRLRNADLSSEGLGSLNNVRGLFPENVDVHDVLAWLGDTKRRGAFAPGGLMYDPATGATVDPRTRGAFEPIRNEFVQGGTQRLGALVDMARQFQHTAATQAAQEAARNQPQAAPARVTINSINVGTMHASPATASRSLQGWIGTHPQPTHKIGVP